MPDIRLIAMDMDGTLLNSKQQLTSGTVDALQKAQRQGIKLALCSGRPAGDLAIFSLENGLEDVAFLSLNGTYCLENLLAKPFCNHVMSEKLLADTLAVIQEEEMAFCCYAQNRLVIFPKNGENEKTFFLNHTEGLLAPEVLWGEKGLERVLDQGVNKIIPFAKDQESWERAREKLLKVEGLDVSTSWPLDFELMPLPYGKGTAVSELAQHLGLNASQVMACGDYDNDIGMIEWAEYGVAMANATERIKKAARIQTLSNDEDGVAHAIRTYALK